MGTVENIITDNLLIWSSAIQSKSSAGRGTSSKRNLYGIKKLRELILDLAVRGLLVPQDTSDEPASILLEKIAAERELLVKEGKVKKNKAFPVIDEKTRVLLPDGWAWAYIPQVVNNSKYPIKRGPFGSAIKKSYFVKKGYKVYEQKHAIRDDFHIGEYYVSEEKFTELSAFEVRPSDIIISCSGTVGKVAIAPADMEKGLINQALLKISLNQCRLVNDYFKILFPAFYMQTELLSDLKGTAQKNMVSVENLKKEPFPLPPLAEQHRIVAKVDELMALCDTLERQQEDSIQAHETLVEVSLEALSSAIDADAFQAAWGRLSEHFDALFTTDHSINKLKETILQLAVMGKLVPQDSTDEPASILLDKIATEKEKLINEGNIKKQKFFPKTIHEEKQEKLPKGWSVVKLGSIGKIFNGNSINSKVKDEKYSNGVGLPFIATKDIGYGFETFNYNNGIKIPRTELNFKIAKKETVFICAEGGSAGKKCGITNQDIFFGNKLFANELYGNINPSYILINYLSLSFFKQFESSMTGIIGGISLNGFMNLEISLPPLEEQKLIVAKVDELFNLCDKLKMSLEISQKIQIQLADNLTKNVS